MKRCDCLGELLASANLHRADFHVATSPPAEISFTYPPALYTCPHGTEYWLWPTETQMRTWEDK